MTTKDPKILELAKKLKEARSKMPHVTAEEAYEQQERALRGVTKNPPDNSKSK